MWVCSWAGFECEGPSKSSPRNLGSVTHAARILMRKGGEDFFDLPDQAIEREAFDFERLGFRIGCVQKTGTLGLPF